MVSAAAVIGFTFGLWIAHLSWQSQVLQKARDGHRLEVDGRLFEVRETVQRQPGA